MHPDALERQICELAARISVATARLILLIGEFDRLEKWSGFGLKSCAHWLSWRCHVDLHTAREQVRVARALRLLPLLSAEFGAGALSYTKVRALTRIATPDCEADLIELAKAATAPQVERTVAGWRRADAQACGDSAKQQVTWHFADDGMLLVRARLSPEDGAQFLTALQAMQARLQCAAQPASNTVQDAPAPHDQAESAPEPKPPARSDEPGAAIGSAQAPDDLAVQPQRAAVPALEAFLGLARAYLTGADDGRDPETQLVVTVDAAVLEQQAAAGLAVCQAGGALTGPQIRRLACDTRLILVLKDGADVLDVGRSTRTISPSLRRALWTRDGGCAVPGCLEHRQARLHAHHIIHWADGGPTCLDNLVLLCKVHHREVHEDGLTVSSAGGQPVFAAALGTPLEPAPSQPRLSGRDIQQPLTQFAGAALVCQQAQARNGERLQLEWVLSTLQGRREVRRSQRARWEQQLSDRSTAA